MYKSEWILQEINETDFEEEYFENKSQKQKINKKGQILYSHMERDKSDCVAIFSESHVSMFTGGKVSQISFNRTLDEAKILATILDALTPLKEKNLGHHHKVQKQ